MVGEAYLAYKEKKIVNINIKKSTDVYNFINDIWHKDISIIERFLLLNLDRKNSIISYHWISQGGLSGTIIDTKIIFKSAIESLASAIIVAHNHPSGNTKPSDADIKVTSKLKQTGEIMNISLLDHLIITNISYCSMADNGYI